MHANFMTESRNISIAVLLLTAVLQPGPSIAAGALAIGLPADVARVGFAAGHATNAADMNDARQRAIDGCHKSMNASDAARKLCKVVATFHDSCFAVAIDPKSGTPGVGWAIAENLELADKQAIEQCRTTAGPARRDFCVILDPPHDHGCDGSAK